MAYRKIPEIPRAGRTYWSEEKGGRTRQFIGYWVRKYAYSPFTAKPKKSYTFYADVLMRKEIESPPESKKYVKNVTFQAFIGTYLEFRDAVLSSEVYTRLSEIVTLLGGVEIVTVSFWRTREHEA